MNFYWWKICPKWKNTSQIIKRRLDIVEEKLSVLKGIAIETIPNITSREKRIKKKKESQWAIKLLQEWV